MNNFTDNKTKELNISIDEVDRKIKRAIEPGEASRLTSEKNKLVQKLNNPQGSNSDKLSGSTKSNIFGL